MQYQFAVSGRIQRIDNSNISKAVRPGIAVPNPLLHTVTGYEGILANEEIPKRNLRR